MPDETKIGFVDASGNFTGVLDDGTTTSISKTKNMFTPTDSGGLTLDIPLTGSSSATYYFKIGTTDVFTFSATGNGAGGIDTGTIAFSMLGPLNLTYLNLKSKLKVFPQESTPAAPSASSPTAGGAVDDGDHTYRITFVTQEGETEGGTISGIVTCGGGNNTVPLTDIPLGGGRCTARKIYRTVAGGAGNHLLVDTIADNSTTTYNDVIADAALGAAAPTVNTTSNVYVSTVVDGSNVYAHVFDTNNAYSSGSLFDWRNNGTSKVYLNANGDFIFPDHNTSIGVTTSTNVDGYNLYIYAGAGGSGALATNGGVARIYGGQPNLTGFPGYVQIGSGAVATTHSPDTNSLFVQSLLEVDGRIYVDGGISLVNGIVYDANGNIMYNFWATPAAVNYFTFTNAATGNAIVLGASGSDTNISLNIVGKGTGKANIDGNAGTVTNGLYNTGTATITFGATDNWTFDASTTDHTGASVLTLNVDNNSGDVTGLLQTYRVGTALSSGETANGFIIDMDGLAGDNANSNMNGIYLTSTNVTGGTNFAINITGVWDSGVRLDRTGVALVGDQVKNSNILSWRASGWDVDGAVAVDKTMTATLEPVAGNFVVAHLKLTDGSTDFAYLGKTQGSSIYFAGLDADGGTASGVGLGAWNNFTTTGATLLTVRNNISNMGGTEKFYVDKDGSYQGQGRKLGLQGADVASANDITLGLGNYFDITGATEIQRILGTGWTAGSVVILQFDSNPNVKHGTAAGSGYYGLQLDGGVDFAATAGDTLQLVFDGAWWRQVE